MPALAESLLDPLSSFSFLVAAANTVSVFSRVVCRVANESVAGAEVDDVEAGEEEKRAGGLVKVRWRDQKAV